ncbi:MAG: cold shock domain-containing protein [Anaerolineae bacterium]|nr:cold shock domain-containing protein [Anaerolineae bacterium]
MRKWKNTVPGNFPKTRRAIWRNGRPADLLGWLQLFPPEAARSHAPANFKFESAAISVTPKTVAPVKQGRQTGRVQQFNTTKGYGFIKPDSGGEDVFVHVSDVDGPPLQKGEKVSFMVQRGGKGWQAKDVRRG